jgi:hypothetical protein
MNSLTFLVRYARYISESKSLYCLVDIKAGRVLEKYAANETDRFNEAKI